MDRILEATETLLEEKSFETIKIAEIVQMANTSVGAFYGRFRDKEALLQALDERYIQNFIGFGQAFLDAENWAEQSLQATVSGLVQTLIQIYTHNPGLARTLILRARLYTDESFQARESRIWDFFPQVIEILLAHQDEIRHPEPEKAVQFAILQTNFALREMLLWPNIADKLPFSEAELLIFFTQSFINYLEAN